MDLLGSKLIGKKGWIPALGHHLITLHKLQEACGLHLANLGVTDSLGLHLSAIVNLDLVGI